MAKKKAAVKKKATRRVARKRGKSSGNSLFQNLAGSVTDWVKPPRPKKRK